MKVESDFENDPVLPQLPTVLDAAAMRKTFQSHLFEGDKRFQVRGCTIERVKYKPGQNCMICYQLEIRDETTQVLQKQLLCTRIFEAGGALSRFRKALDVAGVTPKFGLPVSQISALEMVIWAFPNDRKLHGMNKIADPAFLKDELLPEYFKESHITALTSDVVHYVPEHTCTVRVALELRESQTGKKRKTTLYGKIYYNDEGHHVSRWMDALWQSGPRRLGKLEMAQALGFNTATKSLWQAGLHGAPLLNVDMQAPEFLPLIKEAATTVGALHTASIPGLRIVRLNDLLDQLERVKQLLLQGRPDLKNSLISLLDRLHAQSGSLWSEESHTLHGDLHLNNFFVEDQKIALIDMDNLCQGPPLLDVGSFLAGIFYRGFLCDTQGDRIDCIAQAFIQQYKQSVPWAVSQASLRWYTAMMLVNERAFRCLTRLKAGRLDILDQLVILADRITLEKDGNLFVTSEGV